MSYDKHIRRGHPIIFSLLIFFSIIELSISAWLVSRFNSHHNYRSISERDRTRYVLFASCWTIFGSFVFLLLFLHSGSGSVLTSVLSHGIFLFVTWIIWTAAAAAVTEMLGGGLNCSNQLRFVYCGQLNAMEGFAWIIWILVTFALIFVVVRGVIVLRRGSGLQGQLVHSA